MCKWIRKELINKLEPSASIKVVRNRLNETTEARAILDAEGHVPFFGISNIASTIQKLEKGMILDPEELVSVSDFYADVERLKIYVR